MRESAQSLNKDLLIINCASLYSYKLNGLIIGTFLLVRVTGTVTETVAKPLLKDILQYHETCSQTTMTNAQRTNLLSSVLCHQLNRRVSVCVGCAI